MPKYVMGVFDTMEAAEAVVKKIVQKVNPGNISIITRKEEVPSPADSPPVDSPVNGGLIGAALGGMLGLTYAGVSMVNPGSTSLIIGLGPLAGVMYGGYFGGILGALVDLGINPTSAKDVVDQVENGKILVAADVDESDQAAWVQQLLKEYGGESVTIT